MTTTKKGIWINETTNVYIHIYRKWESSKKKTTHTINSRSFWLNIRFCVCVCVCLWLCGCNQTLIKWWIRLDCFTHTHTHTNKHIKNARKHEKKNQLKLKNGNQSNTCLKWIIQYNRYMEKKKWKNQNVDSKLVSKEI